MLLTLSPSQNSSRDRKSLVIELFRRQQVSNAGLECKGLFPGAQVWFRIATEIEQRNHWDHSATYQCQDFRQFVRANIVIAR